MDLRLSNLQSRPRSLQPGRELLYPVATVTIGGLVTNTLLDFVVTPGLLSWFAKDELDTLARPAASETV